MTSVGSILRRKREADGISVEGIAGRLCLTSSYLLAIEADDVKSLPGPFFYRSFAFQYAGILGLDADALRSEIDSVCPREERPAIELPVEEPANVALKSTPTLLLADPPKHSRTRLVFGAAFGVALCAAVGLSVWGAQLPQVPAVTPAVTEAQPVPEPPPPAPEATVPDVPVAAPQPEPAVVVEPPPTTHAAVLNLAAREMTWLSITSGGKEVFEGVLEPHQSKTLTGLQMAQMKVGNAGGLDVSWNGKSIGPIGEPGEVRVVVFSADDVRVLLPGRSL